MNDDRASSNGADDEAAHPGRGTLRKTLNWLLVPASAGAIANVAAMGFSSTIGIEGAVAVVAAAVLGTAVAKYFDDKSAEEKQSDSK